MDDKELYHLSIEIEVLAYFYRHPDAKIYLSKECFKFLNTRDLFRLFLANARKHSYEYISFAEILAYIEEHEEFHHLLKGQVKVMQAVLHDSDYFIDSEAIFLTNQKYLINVLKKDRKKEKNNVSE